ncbi:ABC transporter permease [Paractinoplanes hotanensis]|uniref:ABC transporter permease n=1 Tax=Paractinoplanes hotanensis TaxID=2906497 RepID=A0ABT0Y3B0_9ACTN|nr:ABC transporter permease [Actinoplanes hotanensis]MCM4080528.1 ABC transporter permease [Actinoplanes hotanensis]
MTMLRATISAEWIKLWSTRTVWWALTAALVLMAAGAGQYALYARNGDIDESSAGEIAALGLSFAQLAFIALASMVMTGEYSAGTIRATLTWTPLRPRLLLAKSVVVAAVTLVAGTIVGFVGTLVAASILDDSSMGAAAPKMGLYLALLGVFAVGLGAALRGPVVTLVVLLMLVVVVPPLLQVPDLAVLNTIADALPGVAGERFLNENSYAGLLIVTAWAAAAFLIGARLLDRRDA